VPTDPPAGGVYLVIENRAGASEEMVVVTIL
jgi:hypothetical protein